ncbi:MAG: glycosyltransferase family 2 protein [Candidatus Rokuibacteriota bacterium]
MIPGVIAVVPVFNEARTVGRVVRGLHRLSPVIVVDDGSTDDGGARALASGATRVLRQARRAGKGAALQAGFAEALRMGATAVVTLDGDGQHDATDLPRLVAVARQAPLALVLGDRLADGDGDRMPWLRVGAIRLADRVLSWLTGAPVRDSQCGFRLYPATLLRAVTLREAGFVLETEVLVKAVRAGYALVSVPVRRIHPPDRVSRFDAVSDGARIGWYLAREAARELGRRVVGARPARRLPTVGGGGQESVGVGRTSP